MIAGGHFLDASQDDLALRAYGKYGEQIKVSAGPNSIDLTLHKRLLIPKPHPGFVVRRDTVLTVDDYHEVELANGEGFDLMPGERLLAGTNERIEIDGDWVPMYDGRSTVGRLFVLSHVSAGFGDFGFNGYWTLEIANLGAWGVELYEGMRIGQTFFHQVVMPKRYGGVYARQPPGPTIPRTGPGRL